MASAAPVGVHGRPRKNGQIPSAMPRQPAVPVPNVVGLTATDAVGAIRSAGLAPIEVSSVDTSCNNIGYVIKQSPQAGARIATGSPVTITVAVKPPNPCP